MDEVLTINEIRTRFDDEWVLVEDPKTNAALEVESGRVRYHSKDRAEAYRKVVELRPKCFAVLFTGRVPDDVIFAL